MPEMHVQRIALAKQTQQPVKPFSARHLTQSLTAESARGKGRPPCKRSDPDYQPTTVLLRLQMKKMANRLFQDGSTGQDLSELIEWIQQSLWSNPVGEGLHTLLTPSLPKKLTGPK